MRQHGDDRTLHGEGVPGKYPEQDEAHVADTGIGNQPFQIRLGESHHRGIKYAHGSQRHGDRGKLMRRFRKQRYNEAQQAVSAGLEHNAGQDNTASGRRLRMRIRQPGMKRHCRQLDGKGDKKAQHQPKCKVRIDLGVLQFEIVERIDTRMVMAVQRQNDDRHQHKKTADLRKNDEFYRRISPVFMPPDTDQEIHRDDHQFPEKKEQEQIDRQKYADGTGQDRSTD